MPVTFDQIKSVDNGARFYGADLHVHSYGASADVTDPTMTVEAIVEAAIADGLSILSVTDHNTDKNVATALEYAEKYAGRLLVVPGAEITTAHGHLLVYFAPERAEKLRDLLALIQIQGVPGARDSHTVCSMADVVTQVERLGGLCVAAHIDRKSYGFEMVSDTYPNWKGDIIRSPGLFGLEFDKADHLVWYSEDDEPTQAGAERRKLLKQRAGMTATRARAALAAIQDSDAHALADFRDRHQARAVTRLKMTELSFEGLRTALIDPEARVRALTTLPPAFPRVLGMQIGGGFLDGATIQFSDNLSCFIGGRGTGKSTAIQSAAYALGVNEEFADQDNCPDNVVVYCKDTNGVVYRYERIRGQEPDVRAKEDQSIKEMPVDAFRVEFFRQGELAEVAKDPVKHPERLQAFLDRHIVLRDLEQKEVQVIEELRQNSGALAPLEASAAQVPIKQRALAEANKKVSIAETGNVREIAGEQARLAADKSLSEGLGLVEAFYRRGMSLATFIRNYDELVAAAGQLSPEAQVQSLFRKAGVIVVDANAFLKSEQTAVNTRLTEFADRLRVVLAEIADAFKQRSQGLNERIADLQKKGLSGSIAELHALLQQRTALTRDINRIGAQQALLGEARRQRSTLLSELASIRDEMTNRRKQQLATINKTLKNAIDDYAINVYYDTAGITEGFVNLVAEKLHGSHLQDETIRNLCARITPTELAAFVHSGDSAGLSRAGQVDQRWATEIVARFGVLTALHELEVTRKLPKPVIKVLTKEADAKQIPINQLSDGQKHTILLTIALVAESNLPLVIDQPEDDLDNAFIFKSIVSTLRAIKERRQVIVVTHNANIAVLGDSELICPMRRTGRKGIVFERGAVDRAETKKVVQDILEGGQLAFQKRREMYGVE